MKALSIMNKIIFISLMIMLCLVNSVTADWTGPNTIVSGSWGSNNDQFGIEYGDTNDDFAGPFYLLKNGNVIIRDIVNGRRKIYTNSGSLIKVLKCQRTSANDWNEECRIYGDYLKTTEENNIWVLLSQEEPPKYVLRSPTGQLLKTTNKKPLELGRVRTRRTRAGQHQSTVTYPDAVYQIIAQQPVVKYYRDTQNNLFQIETYAEQINDEEVISYKVHKYNVCSKKVSELSIPKTQYEPMPPEASNLPTWKPVPIMEYGQPIVSSSGDIYAWARTKTQYKILKWTWQDDPKASKGSDCGDKAKKDKKGK